MACVCTGTCDMPIAFPKKVLTLLAPVRETVTVTWRFTVSTTTSLALMDTFCPRILLLPAAAIAACLAAAGWFAVGELTKVKGPASAAPAAPGVGRWFSPYTKHPGRCKVPRRPGRRPAENRQPSMSFRAELGYGELS